MYIGYDHMSTSLHHFRSARRRLSELTIVDPSPSPSEAEELAAIWKFSQLDLTSSRTRVTHVR